MRNRVRDWLWHESSVLYATCWASPALSFRSWLRRVLCDVLDDLAVLVEVRRW